MKSKTLLFLLWCFIGVHLLADEAVQVIQPTSVPTQQNEDVFQVNDVVNDDGTALEITWNIDAEIANKVFLYRVSTEGEKRIGEFTALKKKFTDRDLMQDKEYEYKLELLKNDFLVQNFTAKSTPKAQWFNTTKITLLITVLILSFAILFYIYSARAGKSLYIRKISGLESLDDAVGRATEMGKPVLFVPGINDIDDMQTIAGLTILGRVAEKVAEYDTKILVPVSRSMVLSTAREIVKEAYLKAGRPDAYKEDSIFYLTDDQFGYVAGVDGIIMREKPAANFYLGAFYAESLILAETGFASGAIQTAGTAMPSQLPFFVAACDYTLIGEELYAASAYLSREPQQLGSLKGQDLGKALFVIVLIIGIICEIAGLHGFKTFLINH